MTRIVNLRKEKFDVYIGRPGKGQDGYFGNPIIVGEKCFICEQTHTSAGETVECFDVYMRYRIEYDVEYRDRVLALHNLTLGCFCKPRPCHGDSYVSYLQEIFHE